MSRRHKRTRSGGFAMVEVVIAVMVMLIAIAGTIGFNEYTVLDIYRSQTRTDASMIGTMVMAAWKGQGGTIGFNPVTDMSSAILDCTDVTLSYSWVGPNIPPGFYHSWTTFPFYKLTMNSVTYRIALSFDYIGGRRFLNVRVAWPSSVDHTFYESSAYVGITESMN